VPVNGDVMRIHFLLGFLLAASVTPWPNAGIAWADDEMSAPVASAGAPDPGAVVPNPYDAKLASLHPGECQKLARQMLHLSDVVKMANDRGDALWEKATADQLDHLEARWNDICAKEDDSFNRMLVAALHTAGHLAVKYFTMGYMD